MGEFAGDFGDLIRVPWEIGTRTLEHSTMATAIARMYTKDGFVVAADGKGRNTLDSSKDNDHMQKIFSFGDRHYLAYSCTGAIHIGSVDGGIAFDFTRSIETAIQATSMTRYSTLLDYCRRCAKSIQTGLRQALVGRNASLPGEHIPQERGHTVAEILFDGYYRDFPSRARMRFYHEDSKLQEPEVGPFDLHEDIPVVKGVAGVCKMVLDQQSPLYRYIRPLDQIVCGSERLTEAVVFARAYIEACASSEAQQINAQAIHEIGGHTHIGTITPKEGFQWVPGFEPISGA